MSDDPTRHILIAFFPTDRVLYGTERVDIRHIIRILPLPGKSLHQVRKDGNDSHFRRRR